MAGGRAIRAARAFVEVFLDDGKLQRGVKRMQSTLRGVAAGVGRLGRGLFAGAATAAAPLILAVKKFVSIGDEVDKMSKRTGVSAETISQMGFALEQSGGKLSDFQTGLKGMANFLQGAERGLSTSMDTLDDLGLTLDDLAGLSPEESFTLLADRIAGVSDPTRRAALAMDVFGKAGQNMLPLLNEGPGGIAALRKEADSLGRTITGEQAAKAAELADAWNRVKSVLLGVVVQIGGALAPTITELTNKVAQSGRAAVKWVQDNQVMIKAVAVGIAVAGALGAALIVLSTIISAVSVVLGAITGVVGFATGAVSLLTGAIAAAGTVVGFLLSPMGLVAAAAIAAGVALVKFGSVGSISVEMLRDTFAPLAERATAAFKSIKDALSAGEYALAAKLLWLSIKEAFLTGIAPLREAWVGFKQAFLEVFNDMASATARGYVKLTGFIAEKLIELQGYFDDTINVDDIKATLTEDIERRIQVIDDSQDARQAEIETQTVQQLAQLKIDLQATRDELTAAQTEAATAAETAEAAREDSAGDDRFAELLASLESGELAEQVSKDAQPKEAKQNQQASKDLRSVAGFGELVELLNGQNVERDQLTELQKIRRENQKLREEIQEARRRGFVVA